MTLKTGVLVGGGGGCLVKKYISKYELIFCTAVEFL